MIDPTRVPAWARSLLAIAPLGDRRSDVIADLTELFHDRRERYGRVYAHRRLCSDVVSLWRGSFRGGTMFQDLRFGLRLFHRHPVPVGVTIGGLALAIGVVTSVFSVVNATMLRPFGMDDPATVVSVHRQVSSSGRMSSEWSYTRFLQMQEQSTLARVEATMADSVRFSAVPVTADEAVPPRPILFVSGGYLKMLGGRPFLGRSLEPADDAAGAPAAIVVSHQFWSAVLNGDASAVGRTVWLNGRAATVVGVLRPDFSGPVFVRPAMWATFGAFDQVLTLAQSYLVNGRVPDAMTGPAFSARARTLVEVIARLAPGVTQRAAQENLTAVVNASNPAGPAAAPAATPTVVRLFRATAPVNGPDEAESYFFVASMVGIVGLVLAIACANTANLLLAAASTRRREIGVRLALGATTRRLFRQMISESLMLGLAAGGLGYLFATWFGPILGRLTDVSPAIDASPDGRVLLFAIVVAVVSGVGAGISPARFGARGHVLAALKATVGPGGQGRFAARFRSSFIGFQAAVSMLLLVGAALLARTAMLTARTGVGFDADRLLAVSLATPEKGLDEQAYFERALSTVRALPSVEGAALTQYRPFGYSIETVRLLDPESPYRLYRERVDADYFPTAGVRLVRGRAFTTAEVASAAPVAIISESVARAFFQGSDPVGRPLANLPTRDPQEPATIIGVAADAMTNRQHTQSFGTVYLPLLRRGSTPRGREQGPPTLLVRSAHPAVLAGTVEHALRQIDSRVRPTADVLQSDVDAYLDSKQMIALLAGPTAAMALLLATLGVYGVTAFVVTQRTHEVSVRMALGASAGTVTRWLVAESLRPVLIGLAAGLAIALAVSRVFASMLSGISPHDPVAIGLSAATLLSAALVAVIVPARRVARTDPASVLRQS